MRFAGIKRVRRVQRDIEKAHPLQINFQNRHVCAESLRHACGVDAGRAAAQHDNFSRQHSRHAAEQHAASTKMFREKIAAHEHAHAPSDLAHRFEQRQTAVHLDCFVSDARRAGLDERVRENFVRRQMQIGEDDLSRTQQRILGRQRLFDLHDQVSLLEYGGV